MEDISFITLHRKIMKWEWYDDANTFRVFIHCLLLANHADKKYRGTLVKRGTFLTGYKVLAKQLSLSIQQVRTSLDKLKSTNEIKLDMSTFQIFLMIVGN